MRLISIVVSALLFCSSLSATAATSRPSDRDLTDRPLTDQQEKDYRLALMEAQKPKDLEVLRKIESEIDRTEAAWKAAQDKSTADRRQLKRNDKQGDGKADDHERRLQTKDAARDRYEDALKVCGAARKAILSLRRGMSLSAQSAVHFKFGQEKKAVNASTSAISSLLSAFKEWPERKPEATSADSTVSDAGFMSFRPTLDSAVGLHLTAIFGWADNDPWLSGVAWTSVDRRVRTFLSARKPDIWSKYGKTLDLIIKSLPKLADQNEMESSLEYWSQLAAPPPVPKPQEPRF